MYISKTAKQRQRSQKQMTNYSLTSINMNLFFQCAWGWGFFMYKVVDLKIQRQVYRKLQNNFTGQVFEGTWCLRFHFTVCRYSRNNIPPYLHVFWVQVPRCRMFVPFVSFISFCWNFSKGYDMCVAICRLIWLLCASVRIYWPRFFYFVLLVSNEVGLNYIFVLIGAYFFIEQQLPQNCIFLKKILLNYC